MQLKTSKYLLQLKSIDGMAHLCGANVFKLCTRYLIDI